MSVTKLKVVRETFTDTTAIGKLYIDDIFFCYTLEDKDRGLFQGLPIDKILQGKIHGKTAIPYGAYDVVLNYSPKFKMITPRLLKVPGYEGVLIHAGNIAKNTEGCILVGNSVAPDFIGASRPAFSALMVELKKAEKIFIEIVKV